MGWPEDAIKQKNKGRRGPCKLEGSVEQGKYCKQTESEGDRCGHESGRGSGPNKPPGRGTKTQGGGGGGGGGGDDQP